MLLCMFTIFIWFSPLEKTVKWVGTASSYLYISDIRALVWYFAWIVCALVHLITDSLCSYFISILDDVSIVRIALNINFNIKKDFWLEICHRFEIKWKNMVIWIDMINFWYIYLFRGTIIAFEKISIKVVLKAIKLLV